MGGAIALELARRGAVASATGISPAGFWNARELAFAQHSLRASRAIVRRLRPAVPALSRTAAGRVALFSQIYGRPWRLPPADAVATIDAFLAAPAFDSALDGFGPYRFGAGDELRGVPVTIAWGTRDALLIPRQASACPAAAAERTPRDACRAAATCPFTTTRRPSRRCCWRGAPKRVRRWPRRWRRRARRSAPAPASAPRR